MIRIYHRISGMRDTIVSKKYLKREFSKSGRLSEKYLSLYFVGINALIMSSYPKVWDKMYNDFREIGLPKRICEELVKTVKESIYDSVWLFDKVKEILSKYGYIEKTEQNIERSTGEVYMSRR